MGAKSKRKGKRGELEAAAEIRRLFRCEARRGQQYAGDATAPDIQTAIPGVHFEVKRAEHLSLYKALEQATWDAGVAMLDAGVRVPVVLYRANQHDWAAILWLADLPWLATQLYLTLAENAPCPT